VLAVLVACAAALAGCSGTDESAPSAPASHDYLPGLRAFPFVPAKATSAPVVVMIPGGAWRGADPTGLQPLAAALADRGVVAVPVHIRTAGDGVVFPVPVEDVLCALADGVATARAAGIEPTRVALLGHSSGAHLAALATLDPEQFTPHCEDPLVRADAFVGLAGPYDIRTFTEAASALFRPGASFAEWDAANPVLLAAHHADVPVLLLHGNDDERVPVGYSRDFATALSAAGHPTTLTVLPGEDHDSIYAAQVVAPRIAEWLTSLPQD
jgi:acetyl esterase/lipase